MVDEEKKRLEALLSSDDIKKVTDTLLYIAHNVSDVEWAEGQCMRMAENSNDDIIGLALTCLGHVARINGRISKNIVIPFLKEKIKNSNAIISTRAEDALNDINMFT